MTEKQRENIDALIASDKFENWEMAYQLAIGIGDEDFIKECLVKIYTRKILQIQTTLDKLAAASGISQREAYFNFAQTMRWEGIEGNDECIATYFEQAAQIDSFSTQVNSFPKGGVFTFGSEMDEFIPRKPKP